MPTALIIDDVVDIRLLVHDLLVSAGFTVVEAGSGPEALALLARRGAPDVIVLDVQMPEMDGWDTLAAIRGDEAIADVPVIMCTVKARADDIDRARELGCDGYITKPFAVTALIEEILAVTSRTREEQQALRESRL